jgi:FkbM family methyltransferase
MNRLSRYAAAEAMRLSRAVFRHALFRLHGVVHDTVTIQTNQGRLTVSTRDHGIGARLYRERQYEYDSSLRAICFLKEMGFVPQSNVCMLDVGANFGVISLGLILAGQIQRAIAIEPEPGNYCLLRRNVEQNGLSDQMLCLQLAVGDKASTLSMEISPNNRGDHRIRRTTAPGATERQNESSRQTIQVNSLPLKQILELPEIHNRAMSSPSLMWIDVQGYEGYVFKGGRSLLDGGLPTVSEIWPYGILRAGMALEESVDIVSSIWSDYWIERRQRFVRYPITVFDRYLDELGTNGYFENVIFTKS